MGAKGAEMPGWKRSGFLLGFVLMLIVAVGCDGKLRFKFARYPDTPVVIGPPAGLSSSDLAAIVVAIR